MPYNGFKSIALKMIMLDQKERHRTQLNGLKAKNLSISHAYGSNTNKYANKKPTAETISHSL
jgi:hypothetical protein